MIREAIVIPNRTKRVLALLEGREGTAMVAKRRNGMAKE